jgi:hypothetical protein
MISTLIYLLVLLIVFALVWWVLSLIPLPAPMRQIANVVLAVIFALVIIFYVLLPLAGHAGAPGWR